MKKLLVSILAYNRLDMLKESVKEIRKQISPPHRILVVNNASTDGTKEWLASQEDLIVINQENTGSEGGFYTCLLTGYALGYDWVMTLDDDIIPENGCMDSIFSSQYFQNETTGFIACRVMNTEGKTYMTPGPCKHYWNYYDTIAQNNAVEVSSGTWAGLIVSRNAIEKAGLPISEFFLWDGDLEYTERISRTMPCFLLLNASIKHYQGNGSSEGFRIKYLYLSRNRFARIMISDASVLKKTIQVAKSTYWIFSKIISGKFPVNALLWACKGLFLFKPKIRHITDVSVRREMENLPV